MKFFKKLVGDNIYLSPRSVEDAEKYIEFDLHRRNPGKSTVLPV